MIFINCLGQYNEIHVFTKPSSSMCQCSVEGGRLILTHYIAILKIGPYSFISIVASSEKILGHNIFKNIILITSTCK